MGCITPGKPESPRRQARGSVGTRRDSQQDCCLSPVSGEFRSLFHTQHLNSHLPCSVAGQTFIIQVNEPREASDKRIAGEGQLERPGGAKDDGHAQLV